MPNWQPNWEDVKFDHAKAQAAIDQCNNSAGALDNALTGWATALGALTTNGQWVGAYRDQFDTAIPGFEQDANDTRDALRQLAGQITTAAGQATTEQARRVADRERWQQEAEQERANRPSGGHVPE